MASDQSTQGFTGALLRWQLSERRIEAVLTVHEDRRDMQRGKGVGASRDETCRDAWQRYFCLALSAETWGPGNPTTTLESFVGSTLQE